MYDRKINLMDKTTFPNVSIYLDMENPNPSSRKISREVKSDEEIIEAVTADMCNSLGEDIEP